MAAKDEAVEDFNNVVIAMVTGHRDEGLAYTLGAVQAAVTHHADAKTLRAMAETLALVRGA